MKHCLSIIILATTVAGPALAEDNSITVQSSKGTRTISDTTQHTQLSNGTTVSTSTGSDGKANGGGGPAASGTTGVSREGE